MMTVFSTLRKATRVFYVVVQSNSNRVSKYALFSNPLNLTFYISKINHKMNHRMSTFTIPKRRIHHFPILNTHKSINHHQTNLNHFKSNMNFTNKHILNNNHFRVINRSHFTSIKNNQMTKSIQTVSPATFHQYKHFTQQQEPDLITSM